MKGPRFDPGCIHTFAALDLHDLNRELSICFLQDRESGRPKLQPGLGTKITNDSNLSQIFVCRSNLDP